MLLTLNPTTETEPYTPCTICQSPINPTSLESLNRQQAPLRSASEFWHLGWGFFSSFELGFLALAFRFCGLGFIGLSVKSLGLGFTEESLRLNVLGFAVRELGSGGLAATLRFDGDIFHQSPNLQGQPCKLAFQKSKDERGVPHPHSQRLDSAGCPRDSPTSQLARMARTPRPGMPARSSPKHPKTARSQGAKELPAAACAQG